MINAIDCMYCKLPLEDELLINFVNLSRCMVHICQMIKFMTIRLNMMMFMTTCAKVKNVDLYIYFVICLCGVHKGRLYVIIAWHMLMLTGQMS